METLPLLLFSARVCSAVLSYNLVKRMSPSFILAHHSLWNSCFLIQFEQLWEFRLKQNKKALPLCLMLTFKLARGLLGLNRRCVVSSGKDLFLFFPFFLFNRKFLTETKGPRESVEKSEYLMWLSQWKIKKKYQSCTAPQFLCRNHGFMKLGLVILFTGDLK